jgi:hypothetical protein
LRVCYSSEKAQGNDEREYHHGLYKRGRRKGFNLVFPPLISERAYVGSAQVTFPEFET